MPDQQTQQQPTGGTPNPPPGGANPPNQQANPPPQNNQPPAGEKPPGAPPADGGRRAAGTLYEDLGVDKPDVKGSASWPENWRMDMGGDEKLAKRLERYQSPADVAKALLAAQDRLRSGEYKRAAPPEGADEKAIAAWREEQGLPATPEAYTFEYEGKAVDLSTLDPETKGSLGTLQTEMHKANFTKDQAAVVNKWLADTGLKGAEAQTKFDAEKADLNDDDLRATWGSDFKVNLAANLNFMDAQFGAENTDALITARLPDGTRLSDAPWFNKAINAIARAANGGEVGGIFAGTAEAKSIESRISEIEGIMRTDYNKYLGDPKMVKEYGELLAKRPEKK